MNIRQKQLDKRHYLRPVITTAYLLLVIYGSLYPMSNWRIPVDENWFSLFDITARYMPRSDYITNLLVYIPLGILLTISLRSRFKKLRLITTVVSIISTLSLALEWLQVFLPRVPSLIDWVLNVVGGLIGSLAAYFAGKQSRSGMILREWRYRWFAHGRFADLALVILAIWALSMLSPLAPITTMDELTEKLILHNSNNQWFVYTNIIIYCLTIGFLLSFISITPIEFWRLFIGFTLTIFLLRLFVADANTDLLFWVSGLFAILMLWFLLRLEIHIQAIVILFLLAFSYITTHTWGAPHYVSAEQMINWLPFNQQIGKVQRFGEILQVFFVFLSLSYCAIAVKPHNDFNFGMIGGFVVVSIVLIIETQTKQVDVTEIILALGAWTIPWIHPEIRKGPQKI
ncbi:MAG: VanZ family protein [Gammaproteobacteria bacterium]|nr:VanZ family protein [Gammaproteobacteria bacterium]